MANENADNHEWDCAMCGGAADLRGHRPCPKTGYNELKITRCFKHGEKWAAPLKDRVIPAWVRERGSFRDAKTGRVVDLSGKAVDAEPAPLRRSVPRETDGARRAREASAAWGRSHGMSPLPTHSGYGGGWPDREPTPIRKAKPEPKIEAEPLDDELAALIKSTESEAAARIKADEGTSD